MTLANFKDKAIFVTGGLYGKSLATVEFYLIDSDLWSLSAPDLNIRRHNHSSCALQDKIYVFGGYNTSMHSFLNAIETLEVKSTDIDNFKDWSLIELSN